MAADSVPSRTGLARSEQLDDWQEPSVQWGSDRIAQFLRDTGIEYICLNPGSSFRGLHDSLVNFLGNRSPSIMLCLHEEHAAAIAHGYAKVTGRPMAIALHANVGLMHATMAIFNAWCDRVPMLVLGATGPVDAAKRRPYIDWIHTMRDQGALIRPFIKWDDQPASIEAMEEAFLRAMQIGSTAPAAPVYLNLDSIIQEAPYEPSSAPAIDHNRFKPIAAPAPDPDMLAAAMEILVKAERPAILMGRVSRDPEDWKRRVALAEKLGARVATDLKAGSAFPTAHPLHAGIPGMSLTASAKDALREADVILSLDWVDLAGALSTIWPDEPAPAKVIQVSVDHHVHNGFSFDHLALPPVDLHFATTPQRFVAALEAQLPEARAPSTFSAPAPAPVAPPQTGELTLAHIASALRDAVGDTPVSLTRLPLGWDGALWTFDHSLDQLGHSGGGGVGSGPGMTVGSALALGDSGRIPVGILGDGDTVMGVSAIWTATHCSVPMLIIVANNRSFFNDEVHQERVARRRGRPVENKWIGQRISEPDVDIAALATAQGAEAWGPVADFDELNSTMRKAIDSVRAGKVALIDVHIGLGYDGTGAS